MIETLISSKTRIKLLLKFFLNSSTKSYLRGLESEFGESSNAIRLELNRLEKAGMLSSSLSGNKKIFQANKKHPLFKEVHNIILKQIGFDKIIENVIERLGDVEKVYVSGAFAKGIDSPIIDLVFIGDVNKIFLIELIERVETMISRKVRYVIFKEDEEHLLGWNNNNMNPLLLWSNENRIIE